MATRKTDTPATSRKRESTFDPDKFLDAYDEGCREVDALLYAARKQVAASAPCKKPASRTKKKPISTASPDDNVIIAVEPIVTTTTDKSTKAIEATETVESITMDKTDIPIATTTTVTTDKVTEAKQ